MSKMQSILGVVGLSLLGSCLAFAQFNDPDAPMTFFLTSNGPGKGANLGGLAGADAHCQMLAESAGAGNHTWRAYLSTQGPNAVNAKDRIGNGPWHNANGDRIAENVANLHGLRIRISAQAASDERGRRIPGTGYVPNRHDVLTGTQSDGTAFPPGEDYTCGNWTKTDDNGRAQVGHFDMPAWNSLHRNFGCTAEGVLRGGGDGLFYCFAAD